MEDCACCLAPLVKKKQSDLKKSSFEDQHRKKNKAKRHCIICGSENHNRRRCDQEPDAKSNAKSVNEDHSDESLSDPESAWNGFSDDNEEQNSSSQQGKKYE